MIKTSLRHGECCRQNSFLLCSVSTFQIRSVFSNLGCTKHSSFDESVRRGLINPCHISLAGDGPLWNGKAGTFNGFAGCPKALAVAANGSFFTARLQRDGIPPEINIFFGIPSLHVGCSDLKKDLFLFYPML